MNINWQTETINNTQVTFSRYADQYGKHAGIEYLAKKNGDGTFTVPTHDGLYENVPYIGEFAHYEQADKYADDFGKGRTYVCQVAHDDKDAYILYLPGNRSIYIRI